MNASVESEEDPLVQNLLKSYDKEAVTRLLDTKVEWQPRSAPVQWGEETSPAKRAKGTQIYQEPREEKRYLLSKVEMLEAELKTAKAYRADYEAKASKDMRNVKKLEDFVIKHHQFESLKSKLLIRIGDIEKDSIEIKAIVDSELKKISDIKKPLENVNKLEEFLRTEINARDKEIEEQERKLAEKDEIILDMETRLSNCVTDADEKEISDLIKCSEELISDLATIDEYSDEKDESIRKLNLELEKKTYSNECLAEDLDYFTRLNKKLVSKKAKLTDRYDELYEYLIKTEKKLEKEKRKLEKLTLENESSQYEIKSLKELNENILEQMGSLKKESVLLRERIALKDAKLLQMESKLNLSKEELKMDVLHSFKITEELLRNQTLRKEKDEVLLHCEIESGNLDVMALVNENHQLKFEADKLEFEKYMSVRKQKAELKKKRLLGESSTQELSNTIKLLKAHVTDLEKQSRQGENITEDIVEIKNDMLTRIRLDQTDRHNFDIKAGLINFETINELILRPIIDKTQQDDEHHIQGSREAAATLLGQTGHTDSAVVADLNSGSGHEQMNRVKELKLTRACLEKEASAVMFNEAVRNSRLWDKLEIGK